MWFMYILSWVALFMQISFVTLSIAAGLYYLAELVEEYTIYTSKIIKFLIFSTTAVLVCLLLFEDLPWWLIGAGLLANVCHMLLLRLFPYFDLTSPLFIAAIGFLMINHYLAFSYFVDVWHPFSEVLAYFTICIWLVPFGFFVSLSANDSVLPTLGTRQLAGETDSDVVSNYFKTKGKKYGLLSFFKYAQQSVLPERVKKQY